MARHSHWASIKHKKGALDRKRGVLYSKIARLIIVAARTGGGDPEMNLRLKYAVEKARAANMTNDAIARAIKKGTGEGSVTQYEEIVYEGYAHGGVAVLVNALTDNRARTAGEVKSIFEHHGGRVGTPGSVAWQFEKKACVRLEPGPVGEDPLLEAVLEAGADDLRRSGERFEVIGPPERLGALRTAAERTGAKTAESEILWEPKNTVEIGLEDARRVLTLVSELEDHDDIQSVTPNYEIPDEVAAALEAEGDA